MNATRLFNRASNIAGRAGNATVRKYYLQFSGKARMAIEAARSSGATVPDEILNPPPRVNGGAALSGAPNAGRSATAAPTRSNGNSALNSRGGEGSDGSQAPTAAPSEHRTALEQGAGGGNAQGAATIAAAGNGATQ